MYEINTVGRNLSAAAAMFLRSQIKHTKQRDIQREMQMDNMDEALKVWTETARLRLVFEVRNPTHQ